MKFTQTISETEKFQNRIEELVGTANASKGLIEMTIGDLQANVAAMTKEKEGIEQLISTLTTKKNILADTITQNMTLIDNLHTAIKA